MGIPYFFIEERIDGRAGETVALTLPKQVSDHMHTLRLKAREHLVLVDAPGHGWELELAAPPRQKTGLLEGVLVDERTSAGRGTLTLVQGISASDRMDQTIRQVTELGVGRVIPLESERSTVRLNAETRVAKRERWQRIARGAAEQSCQLVAPLIESPRSLAGALEALAGGERLAGDDAPAGSERLAGREALVGSERLGGRDAFAGREALEGRSALLFFWEEPGGRPVHEVLRELNAQQVAVIIGPEGGFSADEAALIKAAGAQTITLGTTILRTETAAVVACALALYHRGAFRAEEGMAGGG
jgi:16S rRNA (uracil1498-N3)-methyltransferase